MKLALRSGHLDDLLVMSVFQNTQNRDGAKLGLARIMLFLWKDQVNYTSTPE